MEWKSSADKEKYGDMIGEVIHHTLFEDGTITKYDVKFGNKTIKNIPTEMLTVVKTRTFSQEKEEKRRKMMSNCKCCENCQCECIVVKDITMIKLKTLLVEQEQENKYPEDAPKHFGGGENIDILGYQTKHFDICRSAVTFMKS